MSRPLEDWQACESCGNDVGAHWVCPDCMMSMAGPVDPMSIAEILALHYEGTPYDHMAVAEALLEGL